MEAPQPPPVHDPDSDGQPVADPSPLTIDAAKRDAAEARVAALEAQLRALGIDPVSTPRQ